MPVSYSRAHIFVILCIERVSELELNLQDVKRQLDQKEQEANIVIEKWQDICNNHEERCMRLEQELEIAKKEKDALAGVKRHTEEDKLVGHESSPEASSAAEFFAGGESDVRLAPQRTELETQLQEKEIALGEVKEGAAIGVEESAQEWEGKLTLGVYCGLLFGSDALFGLFQKERVADLESTVQGLKDQLEQREQDAKSEIDILQEACGASDARCAQLEQELKSVKEECRQQPTKDRNEGIEPASQSLSAHDFFSSVGNEPANEPVSDRITALEAQLKESETALKEAREILARDEDVVQQWEGMYMVMHSCGDHVCLALDYLSWLPFCCQRASCRFRVHSQRLGDSTRRTRTRSNHSYREVARELLSH